jgi:anaerobic selenocysteine-containing dehydrogenase
MCGLTVQVDGDQVGTVRGNRDDVWSRGHLCPKGASLGHVHHDPDRLRSPLIKNRNGEHVAVSWDDALAECERVLRPVLDEHGAKAMTVYLGNPVAHNIGLSLYVGALIGFGQAAGMQSYYTFAPSIPPEPPIGRRPSKSRHYVDHVAINVLAPQRLRSR